MMIFFFLHLGIRLRVWRGESRKWIGIWPLQENPGKLLEPIQRMSRGEFEKHTEGIGIVRECVITL